MSELRITHTSTVTADQIDHLGHMNVRFYAVMARLATHALLVDLGANEHDGEVAIVDLYTRHFREQLVGTELEVRSGVLDASAGSIRVYHELANSASGELAATFIYRVDASIALDHIDVVALPEHGAPRSIDLVSVASNPTIEEVRSLGLAMRAERTLTSDDTEGGRTVTPNAVPMLIWGGRSVDGSDQSLTMTGPNGETMGWATMETRIRIHRLPELGTRVQAFGATTSIADKTTHMSMWSFDVDTGELLVSFEVVSVLFNIDERRAMSIPDDLRAEHSERLHPELGVGAAP